MGEWVVVGFGIEFHVIPVDDYRPHDIARSCWCRPDEMVEDCEVLSHHSMDGRERYERGAPLH